jgi:DHA1 family bicyclomycin/chloramphenicol resistance-like MFS transporter
MAILTDRKRNIKIILILGSLTTLVPFSVDSYLPAVPEIASRFGTSTATISFSLSAFFVGFALGQLLYGPLLDRFGRKKPLYAGLAISIVATVACIFSSNEIFFMAYRFVQALGASVATVAAITMVRDFFSQEESAKVFSLLILVIGSSPLLAPTLGGFISSRLGWQWIFVFLILLAVVLAVIVTFFLPVVYKANSEISLKIKSQTIRYISILKKRQFTVYALAGAFSFASLFVYVAGSPIIFIQVFHVSPQVFGAIFAMLSVGFIGGSQLNILILKRFTSKQIFRFALFIQVTTSLVFFIGSLNGWYNETGTIILLFIMLLCLGFTSPNALALALEPIAVNLGSASALIGTIRIGIAGLASSGIGLLHTTTITPVAFMMASTAVVAITVFVAGGNIGFAFGRKIRLGTSPD